MYQMRSRTRLATLALAVCTAILAGACTSGAGNADKAGGSSEPVVLRMATVYGGLEQTPEVKYLVDRVKELSAGKVRVEMVYKIGDFAPDADRQVVRGVASSEYDLGFVGTRVFDTMGVKDFRALTAPMLIDSYPLENAVIEGGITDRMMPALHDLDVVGVGVLADGLRKPVAVDGPLLGPGDWRGIPFGTYDSEVQREAIRALGADAVTLGFGMVRDQLLQDGRIKGFEFNLFVYRGFALKGVPYVTLNVNLWPQMLAVIGNPDRLAGLTSSQRGWLEQATDEAAHRSATLADTDARTVGNECGLGARFAEASEADLAALYEAFAPVYASLERDPQTKAFIEQIQTLKRSTPAGPELSIPSGCTGKAPEQATGGTEAAAPAYLNGTYRYVLTQEDADKVGDTDTGYPSVTTVTLNDGQLEGGCFGAAGGTYSVDGNRITFHSVEYGYDMTVTFARDDQGNLRLTPVPPMDRGDAFTCFYKVWTKIG
jgi:TRAP-type C4-dicarboxylate transport system substrate-binding protein